MVKSQDLVKLLGGNPHPSIAQGLAKRQRVIIENINTAVTGSVSWSIGPESSVYMTRPFSRGFAKVNSTSILTAPLSDYVALTDPTDLENLYAIYVKNCEIMAIPSISVLDPVEIAPETGFNDAKGIKTAVKKAFTPSNAYQCCMVAMMNREGGGGIDHQNRVHGSKGLSFVGVSIWPLAIRDRLQASVYAGAEKAVDRVANNQFNLPSEPYLIDC